MSVGKVTFRGVEAPQSQPQPQEQTKVSFQGQEVDEEKSNATKYMIGAAALAGVVALGIAGYKGHLGEGVQKFLGGAKKAAEKEGSEVSETIETKIENVAGEVKPTHKWYEKWERMADLYFKEGYAQELEKLREKGYNILVKDIENGQKEILCTYPETSQIKQIGIRAKIVPNECPSGIISDKKVIHMEMRDGRRTYEIVADGHPTIGDAPYEVLEQRAAMGGEIGGYTSTGSLDSQGVLDFLRKWCSNDYSEPVVNEIVESFTKALKL